MRITVATLNETKIEAARQGSQAVFKDVGIDITPRDGRGDRPQDAWGPQYIASRAFDKAFDTNDGADFILGIQDGLVTVERRVMFISAVCAIGERGLQGYGFTQGLVLSQSTSNRLFNGESLSGAVARAYDSNVVYTDGLIEVIGHGQVDPVDYYRAAVAQALADQVSQVQAPQAWN